MKINTTTKLTNFKGEPLKDGKDDLTLGIAVANILGATKTNNTSKSYRLGVLFATQNEVELRAEEVTFIVAACNSAEIYLPIVTGQVAGLLDQ